MQAMVLAAGFGTRLLPHTEIKPKPLFPILNKPLLLLTIKRLQAFGFDHIVVNCHHLRNQIVDAISGMEGVLIQQEELILGTGGGLRKALPLMRNEPLLVTNGDIYHTVALDKFYQYHQSQNAGVTLAMHDHKRYNSVTVSDNKIESFGKDSETGQLAFTGLHVLEPSVLETIDDGMYSCIIDCYKMLLSSNKTISCFRVDECFWTDMGTVNDYLDLHEGILSKRIPVWRELGDVQGPFCVDEDASVGKRVKLQEWACIGKTLVKGQTELSRVVVWDDAYIERDARYDNNLISA